jgi:hypothetical protein
MPQIVTRIVLSRRATVSPQARGASAGVAAHDARRFRRRLASLRTPAPDTLRARVMRELRAAAAASTVRSE